MTTTDQPHDRTESPERAGARVQPVAADLLRALVDAAPDGIVVVDERGGIVLANAMAERLFGRTRDELAGAPVEVLLAENLRAAHREHRARYAADPRTRPMGSGLDLTALRKDGTELPVEISLSPVPSASGPLAIAIVRDISERRRAEAALRQAQESLAMTEERERIARDLHDTVIQRLFATGLELNGAIGRVGDDPDVVSRLERAVDEIDAAIRDLRTAIFSLHRRTAAAAGGTREEVLALVRESARALGFEPRVHFAGPIDASLPTDVRAQMLPALREALSNIARHAAAAQVDVELTVDEEVHLRVADDGVGIGPQAPSGNGIRNLTERALSLGGHCRVRPGAERGTVLEWSVPLH